jgi:hypothetical protein
MSLAHSIACAQAATKTRTRMSTHDLHKALNPRPKRKPKTWTRMSTKDLHMADW